MGPDLELKGKSETAPENFVNKESVSASPFSEEKHLQPDNASGMDVSPIQRTPLFNANDDVEVNITGITNSGKALVVEASSENVSEHSSSFGDSGFGAENDTALSDAEVESPMYTGNVSSLRRDGWCEPLPIRKKKLTTDWRKFISPLMWRCKWVELQLMQLRSRELKYERELAAYDSRKQHKFSEFTRDGFDSKSVPLSCWIHQNKIMKRKKRKRVEEESNLKSYMSNHSIFSYYENKGVSTGTYLADGAYFEDVQGVATACDADDLQEFGLNNIWSSVNSRESDKSFEDIILKIEDAHSLVHKLRSRIDKVVNENPGKFRSVNWDIPGLADGLYRSDLDPASPAANNAPFPVTSVHPLSQLKSDYNMEDLFMPKNAMSNCENMAAFLIETTKTPHLEAPLEDTKDGILLHNQAAEEELLDHRNIRNQLVEKIKVGDMMPNASSSAKACSTSKSNIPRKTKKGKRKSSSKRRSRRSSS